MKNIKLFLIAIACSASALADDPCADQAAVDSNWAGEAIYARYSCSSGEAVSLCYTKKVFAGSVTHILAGSQAWPANPLQRLPLPFTYTPVGGNNEGDVDENDGSVELVCEPEATLFLDDRKLRITFSLDKGAKVAKYTVESKKMLSLSSWKTDLSTELECQKLK